MRLVCLLFTCGLLSACAGSAPVAEALPPAPVVAPRPAPPPPPPASPVAVTVPETPPAPPPTPRGTVGTRSYYEGIDVTEIVFANGVTVVFKPLPNGGRVSGGTILRRASATRGQTSEPRVALSEPSDRLRSLLANLRGVSIGEDAGTSPPTYVLAGDATAAAVEFAAAWSLVLDEAPPAVVSAPGAGGRATIIVSAPSESDATFAVLAQMLRQDGTPSASVQRDEWAGTTALVGVSMEALTGLGVTAADVETARVVVAREMPQSAAFWIEALGDLYREQSAFGPDRDPVFLARFPSRAMRVSVRDVTDLVARLAASPVLLSR